MILHEQQQVIPQEIYSSTLQGVISRCLEKNPIQRPSADEILLLVPSPTGRLPEKDAHEGTKPAKDSRLSKTASNLSRLRQLTPHADINRPEALPEGTTAPLLRAEVRDTANRGSREALEQERTSLQVPSRAQLSPAGSSHLKD